MIPLVPFSPFVHLNTELSQQLAAVVRLQDRLILPKGQVRGVKQLQTLAADYLQILYECEQKKQCFFASLIGCRLFDCFVRHDLSDRVSVYACISGIVDSKSDLLYQIKQVPVRSLRCALRSLTKDLIAAMTVYRQEMAKSACTDFLTKQRLATVST